VLRGGRDGACYFADQTTARCQSHAGRAGEMCLSKQEMALRNHQVGQSARRPPGAAATDTDMRLWGRRPCLICPPSPGSNSQKAGGGTRKSRRCSAVSIAHERRGDSRGSRAKPALLAGARARRARRAAAALKSSSAVGGTAMKCDAKNVQ
jgi:hypothetical protein